MPISRWIELSYYDPKLGVRLQAYADTIILDHQVSETVISAIHFGGYPEEVRAMSDVIYGGATIEAMLNGSSLHMSSMVRSYRRQISHDGIYAVATIMADDDGQPADQDEEETTGEQPEENVRKCYIFCPAGDVDRLFEELDHKSGPRHGHAAFRSSSWTSPPASWGPHCRVGFLCHPGQDQPGARNNHPFD